tara:strand:+ start:887 stop:1072 length:186 start_codon:yes stop_codon:yes gene_type:complete
MKASELIEILSQYPDFEIQASLFQADGSSYGASLQNFELKGIADIGYSDKIIKLDFSELDT